MNNKTLTTKSVQRLTDTFFAKIDEGQMELVVEFNKQKQFRVVDVDNYDMDDESFKSVICVPVDLTNHRNVCGQCYAENVYRTAIKTLEEGYNYKQAA